MDIRFLNPDHEKRFIDYCNRANIHRGDRERKAMFYILSGSPDLCSKGIDRMYDFRDKMVKFHPDKLDEDFEQFVFCTSSRALTMLALNLYNSGYSSLSVSNTFMDLDEDNMKLAMEAIRLRFNIKG